MQEEIYKEVGTLPLDVQVVDSVLKSLVLPFSRSRLASGEVTLPEVIESLRAGGRDIRFLKLYIKRLKEKNSN